MRGRCNTPTNQDYPNYGGRGIKICDRWSNFRLFAEDLYPTFVEGMTLERIDVNGDYEPSNCTWISNPEQANNRRTSHWLELDGLRMNIKQWSVYAGVDRTSIYDRLKKPGLSTRQIIYGTRSLL